MYKGLVYIYEENGRRVLCIYTSYTYCKGKIMILGVATAFCSVPIESIKLGFGSYSNISARVSLRIEK